MYRAPPFRMRLFKTMTTLFKFVVNYQYNTSIDNNIAMLQYCMCRLYYNLSPLFLKSLAAGLFINPRRACA